MKKITRASLFATAAVIAFSNTGFAACSDGLTEKTWARTANGYCKIFFPKCAKEFTGKGLSYSREGDTICVGKKGEYTNFYKATVKDANEIFGTTFEKMGVSYTSDLSKWMLENCAKHCDSVTDDAHAKIADIKSDAKAETKEIKADAKKEIEAIKADAKGKPDKEKEAAKAEIKAIKEESKSKIETIKTDTKTEIKSVETKADKAKITGKVYADTAKEVKKIVVE